MMFSIEETSLIFPQFPADLVTFTEEIFNGKLHLLCSAERPRTIFSYSILNLVVPATKAIKLVKNFQLCNKILNSKENKLRAKIQGILLQQKTISFQNKKNVARMNLSLVVIDNKQLPVIMVVCMNLTHYAYDIYKFLLTFL